MKKTQYFTFLLAFSLTLVACAGRGGPETTKTDATGMGEINPNNALLIASIADRAAARHVEFNELIQTARLALSDASSIPASVGCMPKGRLLVTSLASHAYDVTVDHCPSYSGILLDSGVLGVLNFNRAGAGASVSLTAMPRGVRISDQTGLDSASGTIDYRFSLGSDINADTMAVHAGQLDYVRAGRTDQYRNLAIGLLQKSGSNPELSLNIIRLDIMSPRLPVAKIVVTTPSPLIFNTFEVRGSLLATSSKDGSRVQIDVQGVDRFRLRCWNSFGVLAQDVVKSYQDHDVLDAAALAVN